MGLAVGTLVLSACVENTTPQLKEQNTTPQPEPELGSTRFVSADAREGEASRENSDDFANNATDAPAAGNEADERTVEEGDIYRVTTDGKILNLNSYRGLQIIDMADPSDPQMLGKVQMSGWPVEMYQVGQRVYVLMNDWRGYYGNRTDILPDSYQGGVVVVVDISNPATPVVTGRAQVPGYIQTSRLTRGNGKEALYVVASEWSDGGQTNVKSFSVNSAGAIAAKTTLNLDGSVGDIQATGDRLMVARNDWQQNGGSDVTLIDISSPDGDMVEGDTVSVKGYVANKFNMDIHEDVMRVVSGRSWRSNDNTNHVETFDASDIDNLVPIDAATFGDNEDLFATLFLGEKAFFVTYFRVDPFHAFEITLDGQITEKSEFIVSGWNDFFRPVNSQRQLIGIGKNDENNTNTMAVSLYDITDLTNPNPLIERAEIDLTWSWSEANWDDRAFSVLEKATSVASPTGETETGVVLLPFTGYDANSGYVSAVQIFTFSESTLTRRGIMEHDTQVRRSFLADANNKTVGNLSEAELALHDTTDPDQPVRLGSIDLAPNYTDFMTFGNHAVRRKNNQAFYWWWGNSNSNVTPVDDVQIISLTGDPDSNPTLAQIQVPAGAALAKVGNKLVSTAAINQNEFEVQLWNLTNPTMPILEDTRIYQDLNTGYSDYYGWGWGFGDCFDCSYYGYYNQTSAQVVGDALVYPQTTYESELLGSLEYFSEYPANRYWDICYDQETGETNDCTYFEGGRTCTTLTRTNGTVEPTICSGEFYECSRIGDDTTCTEVPRTSVPRESNTYSYEQHRGWFYYDLRVIDVSQSTLKEAKLLSMSPQEEGVGLLSRGSDLFVSFKKPYTLPGDSRPYVQYFTRQIDLSNPATPVVKPDINVPGQLIEVDGNTLITRDFLWGANVVETSINKLQRTGNTATLESVRRFNDRAVGTVLFDGGDHLLVSHSGFYNRFDETDRTVQLTLLELASPDLAIVSETPIDSWATLTSALPDRALFSVAGGLLIVNLDDPTSPHAQAYFGTNGWPRGFDVQGRNAYFAAGMFGIYKFDLDEENLLSE